MWFYYALLSALTNAAGTIARRTHGSLARPVELAWCTQAASLPFSLILMLLTGGPFWTSHDFIIPAVTSAVLNCYASVLLFDAYKYGQASAISPLGNLLPIGLIITSFIMFGTLPHGFGVIGIFLIVGGIYYSSVSGHHKLLHPLKQIWHQRGSRAMLACVLLWSVSTNFDKIALRSASPAFITFFISAVVFTLLSMYLAVQPQPRVERVWKRWWRHIVVIAGFTSLSVFFQSKAVQMASTSYVLAVKRLDVLLVILFSGLILKERHLLKRFEGSVVALIGVIIIYVFK